MEGGNGSTGTAVPDPGHHGKVCIVQFNASRYLTRVDRAARSLAAAGYEVVLIALKDDETEEFEQRDGYTVKRVAIASRRLPRRFGLKFVRFVEGVVRATAAAWREDADIYDARDAYPLLTAHVAAALRRARVVYDADELATGRNWAVATNPVWSRAIRLYEGFFARRSTVITSDHGRADIMQRLYDIPRPTVVLNVPDRLDRPMPDREWRERAVADRRFLLLYQGVVIPNRGLAEAIQAMRDLPECRLAIVGYGSLKDELQRTVREEGLEGSVAFFDPVPFDTLMHYTAAADVGLIPLVGSCLSYRTAAPNKLFEYMMAGLPVVATDLPEMSAIVRDVGCGELASEPVTPESIAAAVRALVDGDEPLADVGARGRAAALSRFNWDVERPKLLDAFAEAQESR